MSICNSIQSLPLFQKNWKTVGSSVSCGALAVTVLVLGILGYQKICGSISSGALPLISTGALILSIDVVWLALIFLRKKPNLQDEKKEILVQQGAGFPLVSRDLRQEVLEKTQLDMKKFTVEDLKPFLKHIKYVKSPQKIESTSFFPEGDILQLPILLKYDHEFQSLETKNHFYMHSTAAPKPKNFNSEMAYLDAMEEAYYRLLEQQVLSGARHILTNYWGMGAFIRNYYKNPEEMKQFRCRIATRLASAYAKIRDAHSDKSFTFYVGGPTGASFPDQYKGEPQDNYAAFVQAFGALDNRYKKDLVLCPETDIFVKAQELSDQYKNEQVTGFVAPVSAVNASDPEKIGNHWYWGKQGSDFNAEFAIEENVFRRSPFAAFLGQTINQADSSCEKAISHLLSTVKQ